VPFLRFGQEGSATNQVIIFQTGDVFFFGEVQFHLFLRLNPQGLVETFENVTI
jgi:hypothetical protein